MISVICPTCDNVIRIKFVPDIGEFVGCPHCDGVFTVTSNNPVVLEPINYQWDSPAEPELLDEPRAGKNSRHRRDRWHNDDDRYEDDEDTFGKRYSKSKRHQRQQRKEEY
jgi:hypothetical protein